MRPGPDIPDLRIEAVQEFLDARISFGKAMSRLFADEATLPHLEQRLRDVLEKILKHGRIEIDHALLVLEELHLGIVGSIVMLDVDALESDAVEGPVPPAESKGVVLGDPTFFQTRKK